MDLREHAATGPEALDLATRLLQRARLEHPTAGIWEAADLQWWSRCPRASDEVTQTFWLDVDGAPIAAVVETAWPGRWWCDVLTLPSLPAPARDTVWRTAGARIAGRSGAIVEMLLLDADEDGRQRAGELGLTPTDEHGASGWMDAAARPEVTPCPDGYRLADRAERADLPHHLAVRNGPAVGARLAATSLYRPDLDLCVLTSTGEVAGYGLFWLDPVTGVGLVEPMRTEEAHQGRGLARHVLTAGLDRLARLGATRLKIGMELDNPVSVGLYRSAGFVTDRTDTRYRRPARES